MIHGCLCSKCKAWHSHVKKDWITNKYVCVNCFYGLKVEKKEVVIHANN